MASDGLSQIGKYIRHSNRQADLSLKRNLRKIPKRDRARDTLSNIYPFRATIVSEGKESTTIDILFNKPPPEDCAAECIATTCEQFELTYGGHSLTLSNPYEVDSARVFSNSDPLDTAQFYEEDPANGKIYVQVQSTSELMVVCYTYIIC